MEPIYLVILFYLVAIVLAVLDIFLPSGGALVFFSVLAAIASVYYGFQIGSTVGLVVLAVDLATVPLLLWAAIKIWPHTPIGKRVLLHPPVHPVDYQQELLRTLVGHVVYARWPIAPTGQIQIGSRRYNVTSGDGQYIDANQRVKILRVHERLLVVAPTDLPVTSMSLNDSTLTSDETTEQDWLQMPADQIGLQEIDEERSSKPSD